MSIIIKDAAGIAAMREACRLASEVLDAMLARVLEQGDGRTELEAAGFDPAQTAQVLRLLRLAEYKRRQSAPGPCVSQRGFGSKDWRYPVTNGLR